MNGVSDFFNIFFGSTQSQITAYAILAAIIAICITILLTKTDMNIGDKLLLIFFILLTLIPGVFLILFEITCMVTGGNKDKRWWCWLYAWVVAVFVIIYCILVVIISFSSLFTYNNAMENIEMNENKNKMSPEDSNDYAKSIIKSSEHKETFENNNLQQTLESLLISADNNEDRKDEGFLVNSTEMINAIPHGKEMIKPKQQISQFANPTHVQEQAHVSQFANPTHVQEQAHVSQFANPTHIQEQPRISPFANPIHKKEQEQISSFYGGNYATFETFANKKKTEEEKPKEPKELKEKPKESKAEFKGSVSIDEEEDVSEDKPHKEKIEDTKEEEPEAVVEPFGNMNFGSKYSRY
jgi:hypothetical protein